MLVESTLLAIVRIPYLGRHYIDWRRAYAFQKLLVACSSNDPFSVIVVDPRTGVASWSYKGSELQGATVGFVDSLGVNGDHLLVSIKDRPLIHAFAVHPRDRYHQKAVVSGVISTFCTNKDGSLLFASIAAQLFVWLLSTGELLAVVDSHYQAITCLSLSSDESLLFTASKDGSTHCYLVSDIISSNRGSTVEPIRKWRAHTLAISGLSVSNGTNPRVVSCGLDHISAVYSVSLDEILLKVSTDRPLTACKLDPAESRLFLGSDTGSIAQINLYDLVSRDLLIQVSDEKNRRVPIFNGHSDEITVFSTNGDGSLLASGDSSGRYCIWEIVSKQCLKVSSMRGSISSLKFVPSWRSTYVADHASAHPMFELKRSISGLEKISMRATPGNHNGLTRKIPKSGNYVGAHITSEEGPFKYPGKYT
uniref:WD_REPEATS_REGION domain-containing protein n=1 Tax=Angiostrongylus cantonensis TaxID=6313 RepID=A0A0K0CWJ8_ANGCA